MNRFIKIFPIILTCYASFAHCSESPSYDSKDETFATLSEEFTGVRYFFEEIENAILNFNFAAKQAFLKNGLRLGEPSSQDYIYEIAEETTRSYLDGSKDGPVGVGSIAEIGLSEKQSVLCVPFITANRQLKSGGDKRHIEDIVAMISYVKQHGWQKTKEDSKWSGWGTRPLYLACPGKDQVLDSCVETIRFLVAMDKDADPYFLVSWLVSTLSELIETKSDITLKVQASMMDIEKKDLDSESILAKILYKLDSDSSKKTGKDRFYDSEDDCKKNCWENLIALYLKKKGLRRDVVSLGTAWIGINNCATNSLMVKAICDRLCLPSRLAMNSDHMWNLVPSGSTVEDGGSWRLIDIAQNNIFGYDLDLSRGLRYRSTLYQYIDPEKGMNNSALQGVDSRDLTDLEHMRSLNKCDNFADIVYKFGVFSKHIKLHLSRAELINIWNEFIVAWESDSVLEEYKLYSVEKENVYTKISLSLISVCSVFVVYKYCFANTKRS
jgi:hypothetical protein